MLVFYEPGKNKTCPEFSAVFVNAPFDFDNINDLNYFLLYGLSFIIRFVFK